MTLRRGRPAERSFSLMRAGRLLSASVADQALLSATNLGVGILLLRNSTDTQYGLFVLAQAGILFAAAVYQALIGRPMAIRAQDIPEGPEREAYLRTMFVAQATITLPLALVAAAGLWLYLRAPHAQADGVAMACAIAVLAAVMTIGREHLRQSRMVLRRPQEALRFDAIYAVAFGSIVAMSSNHTYAAAWALSGMAAGSALALALGWRRLLNRNDAHWPVVRHALAEAWPMGRWSLAGGLLAWAYLNGFYYLVSLLASLKTVALLGASRMLVMPVNLLVTGTAQQLLPMTRNWLNLHGIRGTCVRLSIASAALAALAAGYLGLLWWLREPVIVGLLGQPLASMEPVLLAWGATYVLFTIRSAWMLLLQAQGRFDALTRLVAVAAPISLATVFLLVPAHGALGAVSGVLLAELIELTGIIWLLARAPDKAASPAAEATQAPR